MTVYNNSGTGNSGGPDPIDNKIVRDIAVGEGIRANVAENVAVGESLRANAAENIAAHEGMRADQYAAQSNRNAIDAESARRDRDMAVAGGAVAADQASSASFGFWMLLGIVAVVLVFVGIWYANQPATPIATTTVINREMPAAATPAPAATQYVPVPVANPATPAPRIIDHPVYIPVPVQGNSGGAAPAASSDNASSSSSTKDDNSSSSDNTTSSSPSDSGSSSSNGG